MDWKKISEGDPPIGVRVFVYTKFGTVTAGTWCAPAGCKLLMWLLDRTDKQHNKNTITHWAVIVPPEKEAV